MTEIMGDEVCGCTSDVDCAARFCIPDTIPDEDVCPGYCDGIPGCTMPLDCDEWSCGAVDSVVGADGCLREGCSPDGPDECPEGFRCHSPVQECGECLILPHGCVMGEEPEPTCMCMTQEVCEPDVGYCIPDTIPKGQCSG